MKFSCIPRSIQKALIAGEYLYRSQIHMDQARDCAAATRCDPSNTMHRDARDFHVKMARINRESYRQQLTWAMQAREREEIERDAEERYRTLREMRQRVPRGIDPILDNFRATIGQLSRLSLMQKQAE